MIKAARILGFVWIGLAGAIVLFGYAMIWYMRGFGALQEVLSPFNLINYISVLLTFAPGFGLLVLGDWLERRRGRAS
jgi:hypothetical protein